MYKVSPKAEFQGKRGRNPQDKPQGRAGGSTPKGERAEPKIKRINRKGSKKRNRKMTIHEEGLLVGTPQINESNVGSSGPHQCSADVWDEGRALSPPRVSHACSNS